MTFAWHGMAAAADKEIEIGALIGLQNAFDIEALIAPLHLMRWWRPMLAPCGEFLIRDH